MKTSTKPKVLMLCVSYGKFGGTELGAERLRNWLVDNGIDITVIANGSSKDIINVPVFIMPKIIWTVMAYFISTWYVLLHDVDVIYSRYATYPLFVGAVMKFITRKPLVVSIHGGDIRHNGVVKFLINIFLRAADVVVCYDNQEHIDELNRRGIKPHVIPNGVDTRRFKPKKIKSDINKIIFVGGIREIKGFFDMVTLTSDDRFDGRKDVEFDIYSDPTIRGDSRTKFLGRIPNEVMPEIMEGGQLFILPSHAEGVPGALLEAMASGMYVIASDLDFTRKAVEKKFLFPPKDVNSMADLVLKFCDDKKDYFGDQNKKNREFVVNNYSIDKSGEMWKELFVGLIKRK